MRNLQQNDVKFASLPSPPDQPRSPSSTTIQCDHKCTTRRILSLKHPSAFSSSGCGRCCCCCSSFRQFMKRCRTEKEAEDKSLPGKVMHPGKPAYLLTGQPAMPCHSAASSRPVSSPLKLVLIRSCRFYYVMSSALKVLEFVLWRTNLAHTSIHIPPSARPHPE